MLAASKLQSCAAQGNQFACMIARLHESCNVNGCSLNHEGRNETLHTGWDVKNDDVAASSQFSSWGSEVIGEQLVGVKDVELSWHGFASVKSAEEVRALSCHMICLGNATTHLKPARISARHASTVPPHVNPTAQPSGSQLCGCQLRWICVDS